MNMYRVCIKDRKGQRIAIHAYFRCKLLVVFLFYFTECNLSESVAYLRDWNYSREPALSEFAPTLSSRVE